MCSDMQQLVSVIKTTTCPAIRRVKHTGQHPFCYKGKACCLLQQQEMSGGDPTPLVQAIKIQHNSRLLCFKLLLFPQVNKTRYHAVWTN